MAEAVAVLCQVLPIKQVGKFYGLGWETVNLSSRSHRYATVVVDLLRRRVLWVGRGRGREDVRPSFELLGREGCARLEAVAMDMNGAYEEEVPERCPNAQFIWDLFQVVAKYGREVIDRTRVDAANRLREQPSERKVIKGARWLLLRNKNNLTRQ